ncbi:MAG TPA: MFS transporter [Acidimicrobiales bacterium]|nr:MFS transporter [Acidimicrobiales bacterium]
MTFRTEPAPDATDATVDGDAPFTPGSARAALAHRDFRIVWLGALGSNVGTWMQNVALGVFGYQLTHSAQFVALLGFAQLGPLLILSAVGGALADVVDRRRLLVWCQAEQMVLSFLLAWVVMGHNPSKIAVVACVLAVGVGNALNAPTFAAILPSLVGRRDLAGAVSLQSVQLNVSRVVGPAIGGLLLPSIGAAGVFALNGVTYLFAIATLLVVHPPAAARGGAGDGPSGWRRLVGGFAVARTNRVVRRSLVTMATMSFFSLPFIGLMPVLADRNLGINPKSAAYGALYAAFGLGAALGAVAVGTVLVHQPKPRLVRVSLGAFAVSLLGFAFLRNAVAAYPVVLVVGLTYFTMVTALSTHLQETIDNAVRGRVMALWIMSFGGTVPVGLLAGGWLAARTSITAVVALGAAFAAVLTLFADVRPAPGQAEAGRLRARRSPRRPDAAPATAPD